MQQAVTGVISFFGNMSVCEGSHKVDVTQKIHDLFLSGMFANQSRVLAHGKIGFNSEYGCVIKLAVRSLDA